MVSYVRASISNMGPRSFFAFGMLSMVFFAFSIVSVTSPVSYKADNEQLVRQENDTQYSAEEMSIP